MRNAVEAATDYDTYVAAHAYTDEAVQRCIRAGVKDIVHGHLLSEKTIKMMAKNDVKAKYEADMNRSRCHRIHVVELCLSSFRYSR